MTQFRRRRFLSGSAGLVALPVFEELMPRAARAATQMPRLVIWYWPEGVIDEDWWPNLPHGFDLGARAAPLPASLAPLAPHRADLTLLRGFEQHKRGRIEVDHHNAMAELLSGAQGGSVPGDDHALGGGISIDNVIGKAIGAEVPYRSYQLGVSTFGDAVTKLYISYDGKAALRPTVNNPVAAFDQLLSGVGGKMTEAAANERRARLARRKSVLDFVREDLQGLRCRLGRDGREKLDAHLRGVRATEQTIEQLLDLKEDPQSALVIDRGLAAAVMDRSKHTLLGRAQAQIMAAALRADRCRSFVLQWSHTNDNHLTFPWLDIKYKAATHHGLAHEHAGTGSMVIAADKAQTRRDRTVILRFWMQQLAEFVAELKASPDGAGTLFDSTVILGVSEYGSNNHRNTDIPFFVLGSAGGRFVTGRSFDFRQGDTRRSHLDILATMVHAFDPKVTTFGDPEYFGGLVSELRR